MDIKRNQKSRVEAEMAFTQCCQMSEIESCCFSDTAKKLWNEEEGKEEVSLAFRGNTTPLFCNIDSTTFSVTNETDLVSCCDIQAGVSDILGLADA